MIGLFIAALAIVSGIVGALVGLGGGIILVPALLYFGISLGYIDDLTPQKIVGLSVVMMIFTGLSSTLSHMKAKTVDYRSGFIFFIGSVPGTIVGAYINKKLNVEAFELYFGILMIILAIVLLVRDRLKPVQWFVNHGYKRVFTDKEGKQYTYGYPIWFALLATFGVGIISGMFGIGGGSMIIPMMLVLFLFPAHVAVPTSMFLVFLTSIVNSYAHFSLGHIPWQYVIPVSIGALIGGKIGADLNKRFPSKTIVLFLRIMLLVMGIRSIVSSIL